MKAKKIWANFSVLDAKRTREFYTQLGFSSIMPDYDPKLASFGFGEDNFVIHFFEKGSQIDEYLPSESNASEIIFTLSAESEAEVNEWQEKVRKSSGRIIKEAKRDENDYYGFTFTDPDGHLFNVLLMDKGM